MINVTDTIKEAYSRSTTQYDKVILDNQEYIIDNVELDDDCYENGNIFGTAIAKLLSFEIDSSVDLEGKEFKYYTGIKTSAGIEWIDLGTYITQEVEPNDTTKINTVNAMDYMLKTNIEYVSELNYKSNQVTLLHVAQEVCSKSGLTLATTDFPNASFIVDSNQFEEGTLNRQVIQAIAQISGTVAKIKNDDKLYFITPKTTGEVRKVFTLSDYSEAEIKRATHPINLVSLGMTDVEGENIVLRDEESIEENGENRLVINDNPFAYTQDKREQLITAIFNAVKGFEYKAYTLKGQGVPYLESLDNIQLIDFAGNTYNSFLFRFYHKSPKGLETEMSAPSITSAEVKYQNVLSALEIAKRAEIKVDKANANITLIAEKQEEIENTVENIGTTTVATGDNIKIDASENPAKLKLYGKTVQEVTEQSVNLCPDIDKWTLAGGAYIEDGYIVFPSLNSSANILIEWNGTTPVNDIAQLYLGFIFNSETLENRPHISAIYYDENMTYLTENGHVSSKNAEDNEYWYMHNFNQNVSTTYGAAIRDAKYIRFGIKYSNSSLGSFKIKNPLVSKVSNSEYVAFVPDSPSKAYPSPINAVGDDGEFDLVQHGKNWFDSEDWYETLHAISNTRMTKETVDGIEYYRYSPAVISTYEYMKGRFKENTQYILRCKARKYDNITETSTGFTFRYTDGTRQSVYVNNTLTEYDMVLVSQAGKTIDCIRLPYAYSNYVLVRNIQVEEVVETTEPTEYVEYWENRYPITTDKPYCSNLGQTIFDTIEEREIDGLKQWCRVGNYEQKVLDGTEAWYTTATNVFRLGLGTIAKTGICTHYKYASVGTLGIYMENSNAVIITDTDYDNLADFKAYLAEQAETDIPVKIQYQLSTPVIEALSDDIQDVLNSIATKKGINYFYIDDPLKPNIEIEYYPNTPYNENLANKDDLNRTKKEMSAEIQINADNIAHTVEETTTNIREIENQLGEVVEIQEAVENNVAKLEQDSSSLKFSLSKNGGNNLIKNSAMYNDHNFWFGRIKPNMYRKRYSTYICYRRTILVLY